MKLTRRSASILVSLGTLCVAVGALKLYYRHVQDRIPGKGQALLDRADSLSWNNRWADAAPIYGQAEKVFLDQGDKSKALYAHVSQEIPAYEASPLPATIHELTEDLNKPEAQGRETRLRILVILGTVENNYDASMARSTWMQVAGLAKRQGHFLLASRAMGEEGIAAYILGDMSSAKRDTVVAWEISKVFHDDAAHVRYATLYGAGMSELHRYNEALLALNDAVATAQRNPAVAYPDLTINLKIDILRNQHRFQEALGLANEALRHLSGPTLGGRFYQLLTARGAVYQDMGDLDHAATDYNQALADAKQIDYWRGMVEGGGYLARTEQRQGKLTLALSSIDAAINANKNIPDELYFAPRDLAIKAEILYRLGQKREAESLYKKSTVLIDALLAHAPTRNVERLLLTELSEVYTGYFVAMTDEHDYASAFRVLEKARGRIEAQALLHREPIQPHTPSPEEKKLTSLNLALIDAADDKSREDITRQIYDTELQVYDVDSLEGITATRPIRLNQLQSQLRNDELLIEYVLAIPHSFVIAVTRASVHVYALASQPSIDAAVTEYRDRLRTGKTDDDLATRLYDVLLGPVLELQDKSQLIIVPDGNLHLLPFDALVHADKYLLATHTVSVEPSATVLGIIRTRGKDTQAAALPFLGVAGWTDTSSVTTGSVRAIFPLTKDRLVPLPESKKEVESIASILAKPSTILLGGDATEARFKSLPLGEYNVLHLALHGYVDEEYPDRSALIFAPPRKPGNEDGLLQIREIRSLHLNANLVTLSACDTGVGPVGETGVANLVNAFIEAGATSVVSTLWEVEDRSTEKLMTDFYQNLAEHKPKSTALRQAQLDLMAKGFGPSYWASFQLVGEPVGTI